MLVEEKTFLSEEISELITEYGDKRSSLLSILNSVQSKHRYVSDYAQQEIARQLKIHPVEVYSVVSFYAFLNTEPKGRNIVRLCKTIACDMQDKRSIEKAIERELGIKFGETTKDKKFTIEFTNCIGLCDEGPTMAINDRVYTKLTAEKAVELLNKVK